jgi:hypothetical protein
LESQKGPHAGHRQSGKTKKVCLVFAVGPESVTGSVTGVAVVTGPEGMGALCKGLQGGPRGPRKGTRKVDAQERA